MYDKDPTILRGVSQVLAAAPTLDRLRERAGQERDLSTDIHLILSRHHARRRRPALVLLHRQGCPAAAAFFAERCVLGFGIGLLRAGDQVGDGAVIARPEEREAALLAAIHALLRGRHCHTVAATLSGVAENHVAMRPDGLLWESALRAVRRHLPLSLTFEETLRERFTPRKRKNLLYYQRRLAKKYAVEFVPQLASADIEPAMLRLALHSWPRRTPREIADHGAFLQNHPECFCMGLRLKDGEWLSLITGWRSDGITHMPWQMNHEGYADESLMQVMRTHLLEHECRLGQTALSWVGGTVAFQTACEAEVCLDVLMARPGVRHALLRDVVAPLLFQRDPGAFTGGSLLLLLEPRHRGRRNTRLDPDS